MALSPQDFDYLRGLVRVKSGIVLETGKEYLIEARVGNLAKEAGLAGINALADRLRASAADPLHRRLIEVMTTNETSFFRDGHPFEALRKHVLPPLLAARSAARTLSFWCGACSAGQEPYTVLMTLLEAVPKLAEWKLTFVCTDLSPAMVARTKAGVYSPLEIGRGLPPTLLAKYFDRSGTDYVAKKSLRDMLDVREMNLTQPWPQLPAADIVFLRNVLIYFDAATKKDILARARKVLRPDGYLFLGSAETTTGLDEEYERLPVDRSGCYRKRGVATKAA